MTYFTLVMNPGRSGSRFLYELIRQNFPDTCAVYHEALHSDESQPRRLARAYTDEAVERALAVPAIRRVVGAWSDQLNTRHVVETGWTAALLAPVLYRVFGDRFHVVVLHRHPVLFAASRAVMGNYSDAYSTDSHEQSPFDPISLHPEYRDRWSAMCAFERCLFWWLEYTDMAIEFIDRHTEVPSLVISSDDLFRNAEKRREVLHSMGLDSSRTITIPPRTNDIQRNRFTVETHPLGDEWRRYVRHAFVVHRAEALGYNFGEVYLEEMLSRYRLPQDFIAKLRYYTGFHKRKRRLKRLLQRFGLMVEGNG
jgi:hypothetical protein